MQQRVALYARVSTEDQQERQTINGQLENMRDYVKRYALPVHAEYTDDGVSGSVPLENRPAGARLLADAKQRYFTSVLVWKLDRLGRTTRDTLEAHDTLKKLGITIKSSTEAIDTTTAAGMYVFQIFAANAQLEKELITERTTNGRIRVAKLGRWVGGPIPIGYDLDATGCLIPSERLIAGMTEADLARSIFERIGNGSTTVEECKRLNALGILPFRRYAGDIEIPSKSGDWLPSRINFMIKSTVYIGRHVLKSKREHVEREVPALISPALWQRANAQIERNKTLPKNPKAQRHIYLLRGLITCDCGAHYVGTPKYGRNGAVSYWYRCGATMRTNPEKRCRAKVLKADEIENYVWEECETYIQKPDLYLAETWA
jgi:site-specific DNA recombinase